MGKGRDRSRKVRGHNVEIVPVLLGLEGVEHLLELLLEVEERLEEESRAVLLHGHEPQRMPNWRAKRGEEEVTRDGRGGRSYKQ